MIAALYVGDLHPNVTEVMLLERFSPVGPIHSIRLCRDRNSGSSLGYAYINYKHQADVERAVDMLNFEPLMGQPMRVMKYQKDPAMRKNGIGNLFIKNLDKFIDRMALFNTFSIFGKVLSCKVVGYKTGSKGYGYVQFESEEAAELAMQKLNGKLLNDRQVFIEQFKTREERMAEVGPLSKLFTNIYINNLREDVNDQVLNDIFSMFGPTASVKVMRDENGNSKGFGFVRFERHEDAQRAVEMNGKELNGREIYVGRAQTKAERQTELKKRKKTNGRMWGRKPAEHYPAEDIVPTVDQVLAEDIVLTVDQVPAVDVVPTVDQVPAVDVVQTVDQVPAVDIVPTVDQVPAVDIVPTVEKVPAEDIVPTVDLVPAVDIVLTVDSEEESTSVIGPALHVDSVPVGGPSDHVHPAATQVPDADKVPSASVAALNEVQRDKIAMVDEMDALLKAREAGHKPETLRMLNNITKNRRKKN